MAKMIPSEIGYYAPFSGEDLMFAALKKLPDDYYVFHSYRVRQMLDKGLDDSEADFLIFNPKYGCLCIEAKNSKVIRNSNGDWEYASGVKMKDPFDQACGAMYSLLEKLESVYKDTKFQKLIGRCKFLYAVWFPKYEKKDIENANFGPNVVKKLILTKEALIDPLQNIESIMQEIQKMHIVIKESEIIEDAHNYKHNLTQDESSEFLKHVLCPSFDIIPSAKKQFSEERYDKLLEEQTVVLDFLANQKSAAISGASGTGKTFVALERAKRLALKNERVLFLCYNKNLKEYLEKEKKIDLVDFYTIDGFACKKTQSSVANYYNLNKIIENEILEETFEYKHIIIDEGQDFGRDEIDNSHVLDTLADYGNNNDGCSFFIFYDKNQLVNSKHLPSYLQDVDSKLTLYKNCRNTKKIADTAFSLIGVKPIVFERALDGETTRFIFYSNQEELEKKIDVVINDISKEIGFGKVLITCKTIESTDIKNKINSSNE